MIRLSIKYIDNDLELDNDKIQAIEIENKRYFYRLVKDIYSICSGEVVEDICLLCDDKEIAGLNRFKIFVNFFDFNLNSKKYVNDILKYVVNSISEVNREMLLKQYKKIVDIYKKVLNDIDLPLTIESELDIETVTKLMKINIDLKNDLLESLFVLIDLENIFQLKNVLIFINLKQYLTKEELEELYKYAIYNDVPLLLIDSQSYGTTLTREKKLIVDENLDEFVL